MGGIIEKVKYASAKDVQAQSEKEKALEGVEYAGADAGRPKENKFKKALGQIGHAAVVGGGYAARAAVNTARNMERQQRAGGRGRARQAPQGLFNNPFATAPAPRREHHAGGGGKTVIRAGGQTITISHGGGKKKRKPPRGRSASAARGVYRKGGLFGGSNPFAIPY